MPTIRDVATNAGVSPITASRALSGRPGVREATRLRIVDAAERLGYQPSQAARALRTRQSRLIGVYGPELTWPLHSGLVMAAARAAARADYRLLLEPDGGEYLPAACDGYLVVPSYPPAPGNSRFSQPRVVFALDHPEGWRGPFVGVDNDAMMDLAVRQFADRGRRRLALVAMPRPDHRDEHAFQAACQRASPDIEPVVLVAQPDADSMEEALMSLVLRRERVDGIFVPSILGTSLALRSLRKRRVVLGSEIGFIGAEASAIEGLDLFDPPVTAIRYPTSLLGETAIKIIMSLEEKPRREGPVRRLTPELIVRSTA